MTGAGGFIGSHVAAELAATGWRVGATGHAGMPCPSAAAQRWGLLEASTLTELCDELGSVKAVVHCAGGSSVGRSLNDPAGDFERTVTSTLRVLDFMRRRAPGARLIFLSSAAVYGDANVEPLHEDLPKRPISPYGAHKALAEDLCANWAGQYGFEAVSLRLFSVYGAGLRKQLLWELSRRALAGEDPLQLFGSGQERRDFIAVDDTARLVAHIADPATRPPPLLNGGSGHATSVRELATGLLEALGAPQTLRFSGETKSGDPATMVADVTRARALGFTASTTLSQGLARYAQWVRSAR